MPILARIPWIVAEADRRRRQLRFRLAATAALLGLALVIGVSHVVSDGNDRLVPMLDRDRA